VRSRGSKTELTAAISLAVMLGAAVMAPAANDVPVGRRIDLHFETVADRVDGPAQACEADQVRSATTPSPFAFWSTVAGAGAPARCGVGALPPAAPDAIAAPPFLVHELSADVGWNEGTMDPGALGAFEILLTLKTRQNGTPVIDRRLIRLEPGEEFVVPLAVDARGPGAAGFQDVLIRVRAGWAGRDGATLYGAIAVAGAKPGSEVLLDGGAVGIAAADGSLTLPNVAAGQREVRVFGASSAFDRTVIVLPGSTVRVAPEAFDGGSARQPALEATASNNEGFREYRRVRDGVTMVEIPEGEFLMGNLETEGKPEPHTVFVSTFLIDKLPLTVARYRQFATATGRPLPPDPYWGANDEDPVSFVRWDEGKAYCEWAGGRLPTEAEREKATRGTDGRLYPWGSEPPTPERAVFRRNWGQAGNDKAGIRPSGAGPYGLLDTGGNMWEYCEDWYSPDYFKSSPPKDPPGPKTGRARIVKGGSWDSRPTVLSASSRNFAYTGYREGDFGFRCAANPPR
jgi:formylglycine-generating enzyme required for sulfatase activity